MTDLLRVLPHFPVVQFAGLIPVLERHGLSTSDLLTLDAADIGKRTHLPLLDIKRLCGAVLDALHADLGVTAPVPRAQQPRSKPGPDLDDQDRVIREERPEGADRAQPASSGSRLRNTAASLSAQWRTISTLDPAVDRALGGGIPAGYVTEVTGESGAGKTQFLLTLLLSVQLPPPYGLGRPALYISTEAPLSTRRLSQMLSANPLFRRLPPSERPSLDNIVSTVTPDLESQDHILTFQAPVEIERRGIGLLVLDSVAANYRAEFERSASSSSGSNMGARTAELVRLGMHLRDLAQRHNLAVVVANQVADRFGGGSSTAVAASRTPASSIHHSRPSLPPQPLHAGKTPSATRSRPLAIVAPEPPTSSLPIPSSAPAPPPPRIPFSSSAPFQENHPALLLDHQQNFFSGWGDADPHHHHRRPLPSPKNPLPGPGLVRPDLGPHRALPAANCLPDEEDSSSRNRRRWWWWWMAALAQGGVRVARRGIRARAGRGGGV
ncbi:DNA repair protein rhp57 [Madurella mycetomatis]|uniref:DNA repair protein rhp57 n=1 Tax=Madurella mycetomatis TaxID=100816 RepID=A0A175VRV5_9PEZI|nr:DNA repair protein rhp57 [Madurella mycetomatis]